MKGRNFPSLLRMAPSWTVEAFHMGCARTRLINNRRTAILVQLKPAYIQPTSSSRTYPWATAAHKKNRMTAQRRCTTINHMDSV